jgi:long-chain acyl-CoA synthetase
MPLKKSYDELNETYGYIEGFVHNVRTRPDAVAVLIDETGEEITFAQLNERMEIYKAAFQEQGISKGDTVMLAMPGDPEFMAAFFGLTSIGAIPLFISDSFTPFEIGQRVEDARPSAVVGTPRTLKSFKSVLEEHGTIEKVMFTGPKSQNAPHISNAIHQWIVDCKDLRSPLVPPDGDTMVTFHHTYKGFGYPLGVLHSYTEYSLCTEGLARRCHLGAGDVFLTVLPLYPILGTTLLLMLPLAIGAKLVMATNMKLLMKKGIIDIFERHQVRFTCCVPIIVQRMLKEAKERRAGDVFKFDPQMFIVSGGEFLATDIIQEVYDVLGINILQGHGLTETTISLFQAMEKKEKVGSIGSAFSVDSIMEVRGPDGKSLPPGEIGELYAVGPTVCDGFYNKPLESEPFFKGGKTMATGDFAFADEDGYIYFVDRRLPITKISAQMVDLKEIDNVLKLHPDVIDSRTVSVGNDGENYMSSIVSVAVTSSVTPDELITYCMQYLSRFKIPKEVFIRKYR